MKSTKSEVKINRNTLYIQLFQRHRFIEVDNVTKSYVSLIFAALGPHVISKFVTKQYRNITILFVPYF